MKEKRSRFSGSIVFVLAAAGSAVGVGNIWRFPYLCAKDGGGLFLLVYLVLVLTFGFVLLTTDVAIGRKTKKNALKAFEEHIVCRKDRSHSFIEAWHVDFQVRCLRLDLVLSLIRE